MKNILLILLLSFVAFSCSKDENKNEPKPNFPEYLIGKWKMTVCKINDGTLSLHDCQIQSTKNTYDIWFKENETYLSKDHLSYKNTQCDDSCSYTTREYERYSGEVGFIITLKPGIAGKEYDVSIEELSENKLILGFTSSIDTYEEITYTRVE